MSIPRYRLIVVIARVGPPIAYAALTLSGPWPGMSTTVSRGMDSRALARPPARRSMIVSERLGWPTTLAPPSWVPRARASDPRTRIVLGANGMMPPISSARSAEPGVLASSIWALTRNSTSDSKSQAASAASR